jgi:hypothetical protein
MVTSSSPTVLTQYPVDQKFSPVTLLLPMARWIRTALFPFIKPMLWATLYFGGMLKHKWIWSAIACPSSNSNPFCLHKSRTISPIFVRKFPYITRFRYFGIKTTWYLQSHRTCDKLFQSCIGSTSFALLRGFPYGGRTYFILFLPETLEAFRVARPEAVGL